MKRIMIGILFAVATSPLAAQNLYEPVLKEIEANSTALQALREQVEAQKLNNRTGIYLADPEVEFHYLWGSPSAIGNRTDISAAQSFDFPTVYSHRNKISELENTNVELRYKAERINLLLSARQACIGLIYYNALAREYTVRLQHAEHIAKIYMAGFGKGEVSLLESNKAQLNLITVRNEMARIEAERTMLLSELKRLNGGKEIAFAADMYPAGVLPGDFETWYAAAETKSPVLQYVSGQIEIDQRRVKLNKAMGLPKFSAGYMSEKVTGEHFQGVTVGVSIPLWENKNRVKQAKVQVKASEAALEDTKIQFYNRLQSTYLRAFALQQNAMQGKKALSTYSNEPLLKKALDAGEISLLSYLLEIGYYYDTVNKVLEAERDFEQAVAELSAFELGE